MDFVAVTIYNLLQMTVRLSWQLFQSSELHTYMTSLIVAICAERALCHNNLPYLLY